MKSMFWLVLISCLLGTESRVALSPSPVVLVCPRGQLTLICSTNLSFLEWNVTIFNPEMQYSRRQLVSSISTLDTPLVVNMVAFNISRKSPDRSSPLVSTLSVTSVTVDLNQTLIRCTEFQEGMSNSSETSSVITAVQIIETDRRTAYPQSPEIQNDTVSQFGMNSATVILSWTPEIGVSYDVIVVPSAYIRYTDSTSIQLTLAYDTPYTVTVRATLCGENTAETVTMFNFVKCVYPLKMLDEAVRISIDRNQALVGTIVTFTCANGLDLTGPDMSTCMGNGQWDADLRKVECKDLKALNQYYTLIAVISSISVFVLSSIIFFIFGFFCGCFCQKHKKAISFKSKNLAQSNNRTTVEMYDDVLPPNRGRNLKLKQNMAYETTSVNSELESKLSSEADSDVNSEVSEN